MMSHKWLLAQRQVFFDAVNRNLVRHTSTFRLKNVEFSTVANSYPSCSSILQTAFIQRKAENSYKVTKSREQNKENLFFFCRDGVTSPNFWQSYEIIIKIDTLSQKKV